MPLDMLSAAHRLKTYLGDDFTIDDCCKDQIRYKLNRPQRRAQRLRRKHEAAKIQYISKSKDEEPCATQYNPPSARAHTHTNQSVMMLRTLEQSV
jgi:hypothetical protein